MSSESFTVEVAYALPDEQQIIALEVAPGTTALEAASQSGICEHFPDLVLDDGTRMGIFGQVVSPGQTYTGKQGFVYGSGASAETVGARHICMNILPMPDGKPWLPPMT